MEILGLTLRDISLRFQDCGVLFEDFGSNGAGLGLKVSGFEVGFLGLGFQNLRVWTCGILG